MIDVHVHLALPEMAADRTRFLAGEGSWAGLYRDPRARLASTPELLAMMDEEGVERALVMGFPWSDQETARRHNEWLLEEAARHPHRLLPLAAFDLEAPWAVRHAEAMLAAGMFGLGELAVYDRPFDQGILEKLEALAGLCRAGGRPLLMHVNETLGHRYPGKAPLEIAQIHELVRRCQGVKLILAHFGGGLPFWGSLRKEVKDSLALVRFDTAAMPFIYDPAALAMGLLALGPEYFLLGTDFPLLRPGRYRRYLAEAGLSGEAAALVAGGAAQAFLGL